MKIIKKTNRPPIPEAIKREVRKRCSYGCVICGKQPYDYDHIEEYEIVKCHEADNLTLLCKHHHGEKTLKNITRNIVITANENPFNKNKGMTPSRYFYYTGKNIEVHIGGSVLIYKDIPENFEFVALRIGDLNILSFNIENNNILMNFITFDKENRKTIEIINNEVTHSIIAWDAEWKSNKLSLREGNGRYILQLIFETPNILKIEKGFVRYKDTDVVIDEGIIFIANTKASVSGVTAIDCDVGIHIEEMPPYSEDWREIKRLVKKQKKINKKIKKKGVVQK